MTTGGRITLGSLCETNLASGWLLPVGGEAHEAHLPHGKCLEEQELAQAS